jgi:hypothetical protein
MRSFTSVAPRVEDVVCLPTRAPSHSDLPLRGDIDLFLSVPQSRKPVEKMHRAGLEPATQ